jgi:hypothetical protein
VTIPSSGSSRGHLTLSAVTWGAGRVEVVAVIRAALALGKRVLYRPGTSFAELAVIIAAKLLPADMAITARPVKDSGQVFRIE